VHGEGKSSITPYDAVPYTTRMTYIDKVFLDLPILVWLVKLYLYCLDILS
jgi:hypothetical protein